MAHRMRLSPASLRRSLRAEGQSYQVIKDELRAAIARSLLRESSLTVAEIAVEVGFAEPSAFYRAFRSWTGMSPGDLRSSSGNMDG
ncbi:helix-turn-helix protein [Aquamicrobium defluvii]|uniref:Helix-turn-helix protein n=1 Tax=Aquamicrobium defluvii TaxID=69279 RepID=A0A4R6YGT2_9HYPH|nr:helix-turn-helix protein [Aquamicrobium defluvii]